MYPTVKVITPPRSQNLISLAQVKLYFGDTTTDNDPLYTSLIRDASAAMITFIGVHPGRQQYQELSHGNGGYRRLLSRLPVEPGTLSVTLNGEVLTESDPSTETNPPDPLNFILEDPQIGQVYRLARWWWPALPTYNLIDTYYAGFLFPDQITDWTPGGTFTAGAWVRSPTQPLLLRFECTIPGVSGSTEPVWPSVIGQEVVDNTVTWTARAATELPPFVSQWCWAEVLRLNSDLDWKPNLITRTVEGVSESRFARKQDDGALAAATTAGLISWRNELGLVGVA